MRHARRLSDREALSGEARDGKIERTMDDHLSRLSDQEMADLCAFADGTLPPARRAEMEERVAASPELTALVARQRAARAATLALAAEPVPPSLRASIDDLRPKRAARVRRRRGLVLSAAGVLAAVAIVVVVLSVSGGPAAPSVAAAAELALQPPSGPPPAAVPGTSALAASVGGVSFPDLEQAYGWRPVGVRSGQVGGRPATVVYYERGGQRVGYAIVDGPALARPDHAASTTRSGVEFQTLVLQGQQVVTWRNGGHTCVMIGPVPAGELVTLASWDETAPQSF
jgi:anti-sigma factor RsiW